MFFPDLKNIRLDSIKNLYHQYEVAADFLRLDLIHSTISGNKWFKLKEYLRQAHEEKKKSILTFGGAYSNHIVATAEACRESNLVSIGIIRTEKPKDLSPSLKIAEAAGMKLFFISRADYKEKLIPPDVWTEYNAEETCIINEGGYGIPGSEAASSILDFVPANHYTHILSAVGTGTTLAGLVYAAKEAKVIGISVMKNNISLHQEINALLPVELHNKFTIIHDFHFGGYAKYSIELINFMNLWYSQTGIPSDFVYTAKLFYAADNLIRSGFFNKDSNLLIIHSGGLQGNVSLTKGTLIF